jgi:phage terminase large subunit-like protein
MHPTTQYSVDVVHGDLKKDCCKWEILACKRHLDDLLRQGTEEFPYVFDESRADRIFKWFSICRHVRGAFQGQPIELQPWQMFDQGCLYGWVHKDTGARRFRKAYHKRARGNVKSTEVSGKCLYHMCGDAIYPPGKPELARYENTPEVECAAVDRLQAKRVWQDACDMAVVSPDIAKRMDVKKTIVKHKTRGGFMRPLSKDTKNKDGGAPCYFDVDEYHSHPTSEIYDIGYSGFGKRAQSLLDIITTAGTDAENKPCKKEEDYAKKVLSGEATDESFFIMIREIDDDDDPHDKSCWVKANPILRVENEYSRTLLEQIEAEYNTAYQSGDPAKIREFLIKRMDRWQADSENKYFSGCIDKWKSLAVSKEEFLRLTKDKAGWNGMDLSKSTDLTADGFVCWLDDGRIAVDAYGFMPEERATQHEHSDRIPYRDWARDGWCTLTPGAVTDYNYIMQHLHDCEFDNGWEYQEFCYDPYNATHFTQALVTDGYREEQMIEIRQGVQTLSEPTKKFREMVLQGKIVHCGNPLLAWCLSNAVEVVDNNGNIKLSKKHKDDSQRIDLAAAIMNAMVRALTNEQPVDVSKYADNDFLTKLWG